jgi:hypothetical protein
MIDEITIVNEDTSLSLTFNKLFGNPYVLDSDGIDWGTIAAKHTKYDNLTGAGVDIINSSLKERTVAITGYVCFVHTIKEIAKIYSVSTMDEINAIRLAEVEAGKKSLSELINPLSVLKIIAGDYYISGKPVASVKWSPKSKENNELISKFTFSIDCPNPMFRQARQISTILSGVEGMFHFPLVIRKSKGIQMGKRSQYQLIVLQNKSDVQIGGIITLKALAGVINPKVTNVYTQEKMLINKTLIPNEIVKIDTINRTIKGSVDNGATYSIYFKYWDFENDWMSFAAGNSLIGFSADGDTYKSLQVSISIEQEFYSVKEQ